MRIKVGNRAAKRALERLPRRAHLGPAPGVGGSVYAGTPYKVVQQVAPGLYAVVSRTESLCEANRVGQIGVLRKNQLTRLERCATKRLMAARRASAKLRAEAEQQRREQFREDMHRAV